MHKPQVRFVAAIDDKLGIAKNVPGTVGKIPWDLPTDRKYFRNLLKSGPVVSGWKTFAANGFKPYGEGENFVITRRDLEAAPGVWIIHDAKHFFETNKKDLWVSGGGQIFKEALPFATELYLTRVSGDFDCDIFFPEFKDKFELIKSEEPITENGITFHFEVWKNKSLL